MARGPAPAGENGGRAISSGNFEAGRAQKGRFCLKVSAPTLGDRERRRADPAGQAALVS
jgi:hypothetical protein